MNLLATAAAVTVHAVAARWSKRRQRDEDDTVDLDSPEHAWWAAPDPVESEEPEPQGVAVPPAADPYAVLGIDESASWDEITAARRRLVKELHPDRLVDASDEERARHEDAIRDLNAAYSELRTRKGR